MKITSITRLTAGLAAVITLFASATARAGHDDRGIDYRMLEREACAVADSAHELVCAFERETREHRGHAHACDDRRILDALKEFERRIGHVHKAIHTRCSLPTIERRAEYAHRVADMTRSKIRGAGGLPRHLAGAFERLASDVCRLEEVVAHADHGHGYGHEDFNRRPVQREIPFGGRGFSFGFSRN